MKKISKLFAGILAMTMALTGCAGGNTSTESGETAGDSYKIGVIQFAAHPSLDNCYNGIVKGLDNSGINYTVDLQNGNADSATCDSIAQNMVANGYDCIFAIATPAALSAYSAAQGTDIPVIFCAVSDPVAAGLTASFDAGNKNCIGTSDVLDLDAQVNLIRAMQPEVKKIGVLYTTTEANSVSQLAQLEEVTAKYGIEVVSQGVSGAADIPQAATAVAGQVDCINNFTDNNVVNNLSVLLEAANAANVPVYGSEEEQVKNGCIASISIDYVALGVTTAEIGVQVLNGANTEEMPVGTISDGTAVVNTDVMAAFGIELPAEYENAGKVTTNAE